MHLRFKNAKGLITPVHHIIEYNLQLQVITTYSFLFILLQRQRDHQKQEPDQFHSKYLIILIMVDRNDYNILFISNTFRFHQSIFMQLISQPYKAGTLEHKEITQILILYMYLFDNNEQQLTLKSKL
ncbi:hypothetical protein pb186bvf_000096 [Paramecium bursaria]